MTAFNAVRFRVKPGRDQEFMDAHKEIAGNGLVSDMYMIKTGDRNYCIIAEWTDLDALAKARPNMIATLYASRRRTQRALKMARLSSARTVTPDAKVAAVASAAILEWLI
jgi:hypothetical protein